MEWNLESNLDSVYFFTLGGKFQNESLEDNGLEWENGYIHCTFCETYIKRPVDMKQHCKSGRHQNKLKSVQSKRGQVNASNKTPEPPAEDTTTGGDGIMSV